ncbi:MAG: hypothetical protein ABI700_00285 [Chloroflexota bacterium]
MRRLILGTLAALCVATWSIALMMLSRSLQAKTILLPTLMVLPSATSTEPPPSTWLPTAISTERLPPTSVATTIPSPTATLAQRLLTVSAWMPGVLIEPTRSQISSGTVFIPAPPNPVEPLIDATDSAPPFIGWFSFESDYPTVQYAQDWLERFTTAASRGEYHRTDSPSGRAIFAFEGEGLRIRYVAATNMGLFQIVVDGKLLDTIDAYAEDLKFPGTKVYFVGSGSHLLQVQATGRKNALSAGTVVGLDAIQVYRSGGSTKIVPPPEFTISPTPTPQQVTDIQLVGAPATIKPTATPISPRVITASVVIAYDENGNHAVDPAEGVDGISVRVVNTTTNQVIASGFTDENGYVEFQVLMDTPVQIVVPYFGKTWAIQSGTTSPAFTLLLNPGNQPGLIP